MKEHLEKIQALIAENLAVKPRTPFLEVSLGALRTAHANAQEHLVELERQAVAAKEAAKKSPAA